MTGLYFFVCIKDTVERIPGEDPNVLRTVVEKIKQEFLGSVNNVVPQGPFFPQGTTPYVFPGTVEGSKTGKRKNKGLGQSFLKKTLQPTENG